MRERKEEEFIGLKQRTLTVAQYEIQFSKLSKYASNMVNTEEKRRRRFLQGLNIEIQRGLVSARVNTYVKMVEVAQKLEECHVKLKEFQSFRRSGPNNWRNIKGGPSHRPVKPP